MDCLRRMYVVININGVIVSILSAEKGSEREKLLDGAGAEITPRLRTPEEIMATYRKAGVI